MKHGIFENNYFRMAIYIAPTASVMGRILISKDVSVWHGAVIRADVEEIILGEGCNVQDNAVLHADEGDKTIIGPRVTQRIPAVIIAIIGGVTTYWVLSLWDTDLLQLQNNTLIVGPLGGISTSGDAVDTMGGVTNFFNSISLPYRAMADASLPPMKA
ncbi:MAG: hypothetical protein EBR87_09850, partial [Cytophagia bacterium]|nr:hypothetical protein [Cytophagia bacterium]